MVGTKSREPSTGPTAAGMRPAQHALGGGQNASGVVPRMWDEESEPSTTNQTGAVQQKTKRSRRPALMVVAGGSAGRVFPIESEKVTVGRSKQAGFTLHDQGVSRMHCGIARSGEAYVLTDLGSTHGTLVNGGRTASVELRPGDRIQIGPDTVLQFDFYDEAGDGLVDKLYEAATRDLLTRALNCRAFNERLAAEVAYAVRHGEKLLAIAIEVDDFKSICDSYGSTVGDTVLTDVAGVIASALRSEDAFSRLAGAKFLVLCRGLSLRKGAKLAERILKLVKDRCFEIETHTFRVSLSGGVAELGETAEASGSASAEDLLQLSNQRLASANAAGRGAVVTKA